MFRLINFINGLHPILSIQSISILNLFQMQFFQSYSSGIFKFYFNHIIHIIIAKLFFQFRGFQKIKPQFYLYQLCSNSLQFIAKFKEVLDIVMELKFLTFFNH